MRNFGRQAALLAALGSWHYAEANPIDPVRSYCLELWARSFPSAGMRLAQKQLDAIGLRGHNFEELETAVKHFETLSESERRRLALRTMNYNKPRGLRTLEFVRRELLKPDAHFAAALEAGATPMDAWRQTLRYWNTSLGRHTPPDYEPEHIVDIAKQLQKAWKQTSPVAIGPDDALYMVGSFPHGHAQSPGSLFDVFPQLPDAREIDYSAMNRALARAFDDILPGVRAPKLNFPPIQFERLGLTNPFMVRIRPEQVDLVVWQRPPHPWVATRSRDPELPAPLVYPLE